MGSDNGPIERSPMSFERIMLIFFAVVTTTLLAFQKDPEVHHHFYGGIGEGGGQAYHHYSGSQSQLRPTEQWTPSIPEPYIPEPEVEEDPDVSYENYNFGELPFEPRNAVLTLGYTAETWDFGEEDPPVFSKPWSQLTREEKNAADILGFSELWDKSENDENSSSYGESSTDDYSKDNASSSSNSGSEE